MLVTKILNTMSKSPSTMWAGRFIYLWPPPGLFWIIPYFRIWDYVLHVEHVSCVITNCGQHPWVIPSPLSIALKALLEENTTRKLRSISLLVLQNFAIPVCFPYILFYLYFSLYFLLVGLLLQSVALFYGPRCPLSPERQLNLITHNGQVII